MILGAGRSNERATGDCQRTLRFSKMYGTEFKQLFTQIRNIIDRAQYQDYALSGKPRQTVMIISLNGNFVARS